MCADLLIAGAGPVGLAVAIGARLRGMDAAVLERRRPPLDKACGEGLMPLGVAELAALGVALDPARSAPFAGIRYVDGDVTAEGHFGDGLGLGVRRTALSAALLARAAELGVELCFGESVMGWEVRPHGRVAVTTSAGAREASLLVGADGLHSAIRHLAGLEGEERGCVRSGMRRHFRVASASPFVEVHWSDGAEAYVTPVGRDEVGVALLWSGAPARYEAMLARFPALTARLANAEPTSRIEGASRLRRAVLRRHAPGVALVGDAAGYLDPLTGEGLTLGFRCAHALVDTVARGAPLAEYERAYRSLSRSYYQTTSILLAVAARPWLRRRVVRALAQRPDVFDHLLAISAGHSPLRALGAGDALRLVGGLVG